MDTADKIDLIIDAFGRLLIAGERLLNSIRAGLDQEVIDEDFSELHMACNAAKAVIAKIRPSSQ